MIYFSVTFKPQSVFIHTAESHPFGIYQQPIVHVGLGIYGWPTVQAGLRGRPLVLTEWAGLLQNRTLYAGGRSGRRLGMVEDSFER